MLGPLGMGVLSDLTGGFAAPLYLLTGICAGLIGLIAMLWRMERRAAAA